MHQYNSADYDTIPKIRVVVRKRPLTTKEEKNGDIDVLDVRTSNSLVV